MGQYVTSSEGAASALPKPVALQRCAKHTQPFGLGEPKAHLQRTTSEAYWGSEASEDERSEDEGA